MKPSDYDIASELRERLSSVIQILDLRVFGSRAREDADEYSDMDVFLVVPRLDANLKKKISDVIWEVGFEHLVLIAPIIFTKEEIENSPLKASPIVKSILEDGVRV